MSNEKYKTHNWWKSIEAIVDVSDSGHSRQLVNQLLQLYTEKLIINTEFDNVHMITEEIEECQIKQNIVFECRKRVQIRYEKYSQSSTKGISMNYFDRMLRDLDYLLDGIRSDILYLKNEILQIENQKTIELQKSFNWSVVLVGGISVGIAIISLAISFYNLNK